MEALNFLKFWRPTMAAATTPIETLQISDPLIQNDDEDQENDSFFDLEFTNFESTQNRKVNESVKVSGERELSVSLSEFFSRRKILPIESNPKPQSPIYLLKSARKFRVFTSKKSKSELAGESEKTEVAGENKDRNFFTVKFKFGDVTNLSATLNRDQSKRQNDSLSDDSNSKRFSKDLMQKYLKLINPLHFKASKTYSDKFKFSNELSFASPASSPAMPTAFYSRNEKHENFPAVIKVCRNLGKSKSASTATGVSSRPVASRRDDSLLQQYDGIQSAILHCKNSFNSSGDCLRLVKSKSDGDENLMELARNSSENL